MSEALRDSALEAAQYLSSVPDKLDRQEALARDKQPQTPAARDQIFPEA